MAEGAPLLRAYGLTLIEGSNPSLSAMNKKTRLRAGFFFIHGEEGVASSNPWFDQLLLLSKGK